MNIKILLILKYAKLTKNQQGLFLVELAHPDRKVFMLLTIDIKYFFNFHI
jgi:hypothetical protein